MATIKTCTEDRLSDAIAGMSGIIQAIETDLQHTDDDQRIVNLSCVLAKANRALSNLAAARMCYRALDSGEYLGGGEEWCREAKRAAL